MSDAANARKSAKDQFTRRFHAWWHGYEYTPPEDDGGAANDGGPTPAANTVDPDDGGQEAIDPAREAETALTDRLWGPNLSAPGGADHAADLLSRMTPDASGSLLYAGMGAGGDVPGLQDRGLDVTGVEPDAFLAHRAEKSLSGVAVLNGQPEDVGLDASGYDYAIVRELLYAQEDEGAAIAAVATALKPAGYAAFNELAINPDCPSDALDEWIAGEPDAVHLRTEQQIRSDLESAGFTIDQVDDDSTSHAQAVTASWARLIESGDRDALAGDEVIPLVREAERSARRVAALESGALKMLLFRVCKVIDASESPDTHAGHSMDWSETRTADDNSGNTPNGSGSAAAAKKRRRSMGMAATKDIPVTGGWSKKR